MLALVVDDSRAMRTILASTLRDLGFVTVEARHGREALAVLRRLPIVPDLVLVDFDMPEMNGLALLAALRGGRAPLPSRIMMVSIDTDLATVAQALAAGADDYLMKPFSRAAMLEKLELLGIQP